MRRERQVEVQVSRRSFPTQPAWEETEEPVDHVRLMVERKLQQLVDEGYFDDLPGKGKPLDLSADDNPFVPSDMRLAFRILRNAGLAPPWIELGNEVEADLLALEQQEAQHRRRIAAAVARIRRALPVLKRQAIERLEAEHAAFVDRYLAAVDEVNRKVDRFNATTPIFHLQKDHVSRRRVLGRLDALIPSDLDQL